MKACGVKARGEGQVFSSVASLLEFLRQCSTEIGAH